MDAEYPAVELPEEKPKDDYEKTILNNTKKIDKGTCEIKDQNHTASSSQSFGLVTSIWLASIHLSVFHPFGWHPG